MTYLNGGDPIAVDFLYWDECPSHERALALLQDVLAEEKVHARVHIQRVDTEEDAERLDFAGSPTIRVDGTDIAPVETGQVRLTCRIYLQPDGRVSPLPARDTLAAALRDGAMRAARRSA